MSPHARVVCACALCAAQLLVLGHFVKTSTVKCVEANCRAVCACAARFQGPRPQTLIPTQPGACNCAVCALAQHTELPQACSAASTNVCSWLLGVQAATVFFSGGRASSVSADAPCRLQRNACTHRVVSFLSCSPGACGSRCHAVTSAPHALTAAALCADVTGCCSNHSACKVPNAV